MTEMSREYRSSLHELSRYLAIARQLLVAVAGRLDRTLSTGSAGRRMLIFGAAAGPRCHSSRVHRSRPRSFVEHARRRMGAVRLFKCSDCHWRGWLMPLEFAGTATSAPSVDLTALDALVEAGAERDRRGVVPQNLNR